MEGKKIRKRPLYWLFLAIALVFSLCQIFPLVWLADFSLSKSSDFFVKGILNWPVPPQWQNYMRAWVGGKFVRFFLNSSLIAAVTMAATVFLSLTLGYAFVRMKWKLSPLFLNIILLGMMIPIHATLLPNFLMFQKIGGLLDSYQGLMIPYIAFAIPIAVFVMTGFLESIPRSLEEAAIIDGCGIYTIIFRIILPLTKPAVVTVIVLTFLSSWNEFIMAVTFLSSDKFRTLPFSVINFSGQYSSDYGSQFAVMALTAIPAIIVYVIFSEQITKGVLAGAMKE
jgi:raffinose/stachyose/melibiose transport system permease protein